MCAQKVACHIPFEVVEHFYPPIPEDLQLRIAFWSFPENEEDIRYSDDNKRSRHFNIIFNKLLCIKLNIFNCIRFMNNLGFTVIAVPCKCLSSKIGILRGYF